jgi:hypothetical protein
MAEILRYVRIFMNSIITRYINYQETPPKYDKPYLEDDVQIIIVNEQLPLNMPLYRHSPSPSLRARSTAHSSNFP